MIFFSLTLLSFFRTTTVFFGGGLVSTAASISTEGLVSTEGRVISRGTLDSTGVLVSVVGRVISGAILEVGSGRGLTTIAIVGFASETFGSFDG